MPELKCTVQTCAHNRQYLCALDQINVGGSEATSARETRCDSFQERNGSSITNAVKEASEMTRIDCKATECQYNKDCACSAGKISVEGGNACQCDGTECATFSCRC